MRLKIILFFLLIFLCINGQVFADFILSSRATLSPDDSQLSLDQILDKVEKHYSVTGFSAKFIQTSTIKTMDITDTASGKAFFKRPAKMRWEYETPEQQLIITDGNTLWVFRPEDNQVMIGKAPSFFKGGKGFSFLSDMKVIRQKFSMTLEMNNDTGFFLIKLLPKEKTYDLAEIFLWISKNTFDVVRVVTYNSYGDETRIDFKNIRFEHTLDDAMFHFKISEGMEVLHLDEQGDL